MNLDPNSVLGPNTSGQKVGPIPKPWMGPGPLPPLLIDLQLGYSQTLFGVSKCIGTYQPLLKIALIFFFVLVFVHVFLTFVIFYLVMALIFLLKLSSRAIYLLTLEYPIFVCLP
ncbi:hypothetical protein AMTRI_Chr09g21560 [Amborella trichopoda]